MFGGHLGLRNRYSLSRGDWLPIIHRSPSGRRSIVLSFDDGPSPKTTVGIMRLLAQFNATAAFFLCGKRTERYPDLVRRIADGGCGVFAHGYSHARLDALSPDQALEELTRTEEILSRIRPTPSPYIVRLPYGAGHRAPHIHRLLKRWRPDCQLAHWGYSFQDFNLANGCETLQQLERNCDAAVEKACSQRRFYGSVLLLHEDPFDIEAPLKGEIATRLLERILRTAADRGIAISPMQSAREHMVSKYVRTVFME